MNGSSSATRQQLRQVRLRRPRVDERVAVVAEDAEAPVEVEVHRRRLEVGRVVRVDAHPPGLELGADVAIGQDAHRDRFPFFGVALVEQLVHLALEVLEVLEALVHGREPDVGDVVQRAQPVHRERPDARGLGSRTGPTPRSSLSIGVRGTFRGVVGDGAPGQRLRQAGRQLVPVELLARAVALDDDQARGLDALVGREAGRAGRALPAPPDGGRLVEVARVHHARVPGAALRAAHRPARSSSHHYPLWCHAEDTTTCGVRSAPRASSESGCR